jgi:hypothetical protein
MNMYYVINVDNLRAGGTYEVTTLSLTQAFLVAQRYIGTGLRVRLKRCPMRRPITGSRAYAL